MQASLALLIALAMQQATGTTGDRVPADAYNAALHSDEYNPCREDACEKPPRLLEGTTPVYPPGLLDAGVEGSASIVFELDASGRVVEPRVEQATHEAFGHAALQAVQGWRFAPAERNGVPVAAGSVRQVFPFEFTDPVPATQDGQWGLVQAQPIEVCKPEGQRRYLARLICPNDRHPGAKRSGNVGHRVPVPDEVLERIPPETLMGYAPIAPGDPEYHIVDRYELDCGDSTATVYMDMYHCDAPAPDRAPEGFRLLY